MFAETKRRGQAMHVTNIVYQLLGNVIHKTRIKSLLPVLNAIIQCKQLRLTQVGRQLDIKGTERAGIRRMDRLLSNSFYQNESIEIYKTITRRVIGEQSRPNILVDWTGLPNSKRTAEKGEHCALRASLVAEGRSITLYEEVHSKKKEGNEKVHQIFLQNLNSILPEGCRPCIVTDAGFKNPWFISVSNFGWDYIGRARGMVKYDDGSGFQSIKNLFEKACATPKYLGKVILAKKNPFKTNLYIYKHRLKGRHKFRKNGSLAQDKDSKAYSSSYREPWVIVSSLHTHSAATKVVKIYKYRMTIEESIRDTKSVEFGFGMNENVTVKAERYIVWLMIAAMASLIAWVVGYVAEKMNLHFAFQANTYRHRRVLSFFYLGCQIIRKKIKIPIDFNKIQSEAWRLLCV
jgi:Transposase DDE domain